MGKIFSKVVGLSVGLSLAIGLGVAAKGVRKEALKAKADETITLNVTIPDYVEENGCTISAGSSITNYKTLTLNSDISVSTSGTAANEGSFWLVSNNATWRLYNGGQTNSAGTLTFSAASGCTISTIAITWSAQGNGGILATSKGTNKSSSSITSGTDYPANTTFCVANSGDKTNGQVRITAFKVVYTKQSADTLNSINLAAASGGTTALTEATVKTDKTLQVYLTANYATAGAVNKTNDATWTATAGTGTASVNKGLITGLTVGTVTISASYGGKAAVSLQLTVTQGPKVVPSMVQVTPFLENQTKNDITISTLGFAGDVTVTATSNSANLNASILENGNLQIVAASNLSADETATVTLTGNDGEETATAEVKVYLKAPVFSLSAENFSIDPSADPVDVTATITNFGSNPVLTAISGDTNVFTVAVDGTIITVTPKAEGSATLTATAKSADESITREKQITITVHETVDFNLVTDDQLIGDGSQLIIASTVNTSSFAMGSQGANTYRSKVNVTIAGNKISDPDENIAIVTFEGSSDDCYLGTKEGYLSYTSGNAVDTITEKDDTCRWSISIDSTTGVATIKSLNVTDRYLKYNSSSPRFACYTSGQNDVKIYGILSQPKELVSIALTKDDANVQKEYYIGESASFAGLTVTATYDDDSHRDVTSSATITANPATIAADTESISFSATYREKASNSVVVTGLTVTRLNPIQNVYSKTGGTVITNLCGIYVGKLDDSNIIIMDGEFGIDIYKKDAFASVSYVAKETILQVSGSVSIFNGLYEIAASAVPTVLETADVETPVVYATKGGETAEYASRITTVTGTPSVISGSLVSNPGTSDIKMSFEIGDKEVQVFYKKAAQNADDMALLNTAVTGSKEITVSGFTSWYKKTESDPGFQVQMKEVVEEKTDYTAEQFAQDLLDQTDAVCTGWKEGDNNHDAIEAIWSDLASDDKYPSLPSDQKTILAQAARNESGTVVEQAMARYDYLTGRYNLSNFINGRTPITSGSANMFIVDDNNIVTMVVILASLLTVSCAALLALKKRRFHR